jgi:site-specific DNA-adenine methylase
MKNSAILDDMLDGFEDKMRADTIGDEAHQKLFALAKELETKDPVKYKKIGAKPFVKWVGGKRSIIDILLARVPKEYDRYVEPFLGGGALFFALQPDKAQPSFDYRVTLYIVP